jgi:hypothetical protein
MLAFCLFQASMRNITAFFFAGAAFIFYLTLTYARFGSSVDASVIPPIPSSGILAIEHGLFHLQRVPYSFADYFFLRHSGTKQIPVY